MPTRWQRWRCKNKSIHRTPSSSAGINCIEQQQQHHHIIISLNLDLPLNLVLNPGTHCAPDRWAIIKKLFGMTERQRTKVGARRMDRLSANSIIRPPTNTHTKKSAPQAGGKSPLMETNRPAAEQRWCQNQWPMQHSHLQWECIVVVVGWECKEWRLKSIK